MTEAKAHHALRIQAKLFLLSIGSLLRKRPMLFDEAAALYGSIESHKPCAVSAEASEYYRTEIALCSNSATEPRKLPEGVVGRFPFNKPTPLLCERIHEIEAMLAPLSEKRARAHALSLRLVGSRGNPKRV